MKYIRLSLVLGVLLGALFTVQGQTTNAPIQPTPQGFMTSTLDYFSSNDTNLTFTSFGIWTAMDYQNQVNFAAELGGYYDILKPASYSKGFSLGVDGNFRNANIAGVILSEQAGIQAAYNVYAVRIAGYVDGGYHQDFNKAYCEMGARVFKKATPNTFFGFGMAVQVPANGGSTYPVVNVFAGATF